MDEQVQGELKDVNFNLDELLKSLSDAREKVAVLLCIVMYVCMYVCMYVFMNLFCALFTRMKETFI